MKYKRIKPNQYRGLLYLVVIDMTLCMILIFLIIRNTIQQRRGATKAAPLAISGGCGDISQFQSHRALGACRGRRFSYKSPFPRHP